MKVLIEKRPGLMERGDPGELHRWIEAIQTADIFHYFSHINLISFQFWCLVNKLGQK